MTVGTPGPSPPIVFFDGMCGFCDRTVTFLFRRDTRHVLRFAPLQGETAKRLLSERQRSDLDTMVLVADGRQFEGSDAALRALATAGGAWRLARLLLVLPRFVRDFAYGIVVKNRYKFFGKYDACRLPSAEERGYFLE